MNVVTQLAHRHPFWEKWHPYVLARKGIVGTDLLDAAILIDLASSVVSIAELRSNSVRRVVSHLDLRSSTEEVVVGASVEDDRLDHLGFRIHAPMDVYLEVVPFLAAERGWVLEGTKRFAPSARFQERVGASAEMAQVWLGVDDEVYQLELFDIHTPIAGDRSTNLAAARSVLQDFGRPPDAPEWPPFRSDDIWHYGILLDSIEDVAVAHRSLMEDTSDLVFRNDDVVVNLWHGSHHTKVSGGFPTIEIEFLAYLDDWNNT